LAINRTAAKDGIAAAQKWKPLAGLEKDRKTAMAGRRSPPRKEARKVRSG
jgi:hypothetical protein